MLHGSQALAGSQRLSLSPLPGTCLVSYVSRDVSCYVSLMYLDVSHEPTCLEVLASGHLRGRHDSWYALCLVVVTSHYELLMSLLVSRLHELTRAPSLASGAAEDVTFRYN